MLLYTQAQALILFAQHAQVALDAPYTLNYGEGPLLDQAVRLARGEDIYRADLTGRPTPSPIIRRSMCWRRRRLSTSSARRCGTGG